MFSHILTWCSTFINPIVFFYMNETFKEEGLKTLKDILAYIRCENEWNLSCCLKCIKGECNEIVGNSSNFNSIVVDNRVNVSKKNEQKDEQKDEQEDGHVKKDEYVKNDSVHSNTSF